MIKRLQSFASWLIVLGAIILLTPLPVYVCLILGALGSTLWIITKMQTYDSLAAIILLLLFLAFSIPLPLSVFMTTPLRLALIVGGWTLIISLTCAAIAAYIIRKQKRETT